MADAEAPPVEEAAAEAPAEPAAPPASESVAAEPAVTEAVPTEPATDGVAADAPAAAAKADGEAAADGEPTGDAAGEEGEAAPVDEAAAAAAAEAAEAAAAEAAVIAAAEAEAAAEAAAEIEAAAREAALDLLSAPGEPPDIDGFMDDFAAVPESPISTSFLSRISHITLGGPTPAAAAAAAAPIGGASPGGLGASLGGGLGDSLERSAGRWPMSSSLSPGGGALAAAAGGPGPPGGDADGELSEQWLQDELAKEKEERDRLMSEHVELSRALSAILSVRPQSGIVDDFQTDSAAARYSESLRTWKGLRDENERQAAQFDAAIAATTAELNASQARAAAAAEAQSTLQLETARNSVYTTNGQPLPERVIRQAMKAVGAKATEVQAARLRHIRLRSRADALLKILVEREQLSEGLHLIDFEKQKADNSALSAKSADRDAECSRLRSKTAAALQIVAHMKEKVDFLRKEATTLTAALAEATAEAQTIKDRLRRVKRDREGFRQGAEALRAEHGTVSNPILLADFDANFDRRIVLAARVAELKAKYAMIPGTTGGALAGSYYSGAPESAAARESTGYAV